MKTRIIKMPQNFRGPKVHKIELIDGYPLTEQLRSDLINLLSNLQYNTMTDWQHYRKVKSYIEDRKSQ